MANARTWAHDAGHDRRQQALRLAVGESSVILLHPPLPPGLVGVSFAMERGCQCSDVYLRQQAQQRLCFVQLLARAQQPPQQRRGCN